MSFAKLPTQAPQFDATAFLKFLNDIAAVTTKKTLNFDLVKWKRWCEATAEQDGVGLRDVVNANAVALNAVKLDLDVDTAGIAALAIRVADLENRPPVPFPLASG